MADADVYWCLPSVKLQAGWEGNVKQNATLDDVYVQESGGVEYLLWGKVWLSTQRKSERLRFQVLLILVSGVHRPLSLITYCIKTNRGRFQNKGRSLNEEIWYFNFLVWEKKNNFLFSYLVFSQEHLPIVLCQFLFLQVDFWIKKYMFRYIKNQDGK